MMMMITSLLFHSFSGKQEAADATLEALKAVPDPLGKWASVLVEICSYAGMFLFPSQNSLKLNLLSSYTQRKTPESCQFYRLVYKLSTNGNKLVNFIKLKQVC